MTIQEAIKSGKPFRRGPVIKWSVHLNNYFGKRFHGKKAGNCNYDLEMLATDWEVLVCEEHNNVTSKTMPRKYYCGECVTEQMSAFGIEAAETLEQMAKDDLDQVDEQPPLPKATLSLEPKCECGAEACNSSIHSEWCPKR